MTKHLEKTKDLEKILDLLKDISGGKLEVRLTHFKKETLEI